MTTPDQTSDEAKRTLVLTRVFDAPAHLLFEAYSKPEHVKQWFGPVGWPITKCEIDFRVGGEFHFQMTGPDGEPGPPFGGVYQAIEPGKKIVYSDGFEVPGDDELMIVTVTFDEHDGKTTLTMRTVFGSQAMYDTHVGGGFEEGTSSAFDQLADLCAKLKTRALDAASASLTEKGRSGAEPNESQSRVAHAPSRTTLRAPMISAPAPHSNDPRTPVLLLHSGGMSGRQWRKLSETLSPRHRVLSPDFFGSGENPLLPAGERFHFLRDVERMEATLREIGEPTHIVGHSYGGFIAVTLARRVPELVRSLTVYDPVAFGVLYAANDEEGLDDLTRASQSPSFSDERTGGDDAWLEAFVDYWNGSGTWVGMPGAARDSFLRVGRTVFWEVISLAEDRTPAEAYAHVSAPALLLMGERSPAAARRVVTLLASGFPRALLATVEGAGHMGPISHANTVNDAIVRHITNAS